MIIHRLRLFSRNRMPEADNTEKTTRDLGNINFTFGVEANRDSWAKTPVVDDSNKAQ